MGYFGFVNSLFYLVRLKMLCVAAIATLIAALRAIADDDAKCQATVVGILVGVAATVVVFADMDTSLRPSQRGFFIQELIHLAFRSDWL